MAWKKRYYNNNYNKNKKKVVKCWSCGRQGHTSSTCIYRGK